MDYHRPGSHGRLARRPSLERLEQRALQSGLNVPASVPRSGLIQGIEQPGIKTVAAGVSAILAALGGGPGSEFVNVIQKQVPPSQVLGLVGQFASGARTEVELRGVAFRVATILSTFSGPHFDYQAAVASGAVLLKRHILELGAILRGPNRSPAPAYYVFGIDRGSGPALGSRFPELPGITPDALVTIANQTNNANPSGTITDLRTGATTPIDPSQIAFDGSTLRVFVNTSQLPSTGFPITKYRYSFWVQSQQNGGFNTVGSFLPSTTEIPIGVEA
jgi:hypothetical protein